jgi:shikimate kinase
MAILTISQEMGSGGAEIGLTVATRLGYTYVDNEELLTERSATGWRKIASLASWRTGRRGSSVLTRRLAGASWLSK